MTDDRRVDERATELLPEESAAGTDDATAQAAAIIADSDERTFDRDASPSTVLEHRRSEDTVEP